MDITNYIKTFIMGGCWVLDHHIELAELSIYTGTNCASFTVYAEVPINVSKFIATT